MTIYRIKPHLHNVTGSRKVIVDPQLDQDQHQNLITSRESTLTHAYHIRESTLTHAYHVRESTLTHAYHVRESTLTNAYHIREATLTHAYHVRESTLTNAYHIRESTLTHAYHIRQSTLTHAYHVWWTSVNTFGGRKNKSQTARVTQLCVVVQVNMDQTTTEH